ncbi:MAG: undecaprenyl-diphosphate phosphatase [Planctomycetota bacterium]
MLVLAVVQGLTEFLPVSSSGHLVLFGALLDLKDPGAFLEVALHFGTLLAVVFFFRRDLLKLGRDLVSKRVPDAERRSAWKLTFALIVGTLPAAIVGLLFKDQIESLFDAPALAGVALMATGSLLLSTRFWKPGERGLETLGPLGALAVGIAQMMAMMPGISRSGSTIACGMWLGLRGPEAGRYSFFLSLPVILGATILTGKDALETGTGLSTFSLVAGVLVSAGVGFACLSWLMVLLRHGRLVGFGYYCLAVGAATVLITVAG